MKMEIMTQALLLMTLVTWKQYSTPMSHTNRKEKVPGEKSAQSPTVTPKSTTSRSSAPTTHQIKKVTHSSSGGGGDKNPPSGKIESSHKLPLRKKRKNIVQEEEGPRGESDIHDLSLEDMELEIDIEKVFPNIDQLENTGSPESSDGNN
jgi:hypothetical protein